MRLVGGEARRFLEIFAVSGFAVAQPLLDSLGSSPEFFLFREAGAADVVALGLLVVVVPPLVLWAAGAATGLAGERPRRAAHLATLGLLLVAFATAHVKDVVSSRGLLLVAPGIAVAAVACLAYARYEPVRLWLRYLALAPPVFLGLFLFTSPSADLVLGDDPEAHPASAASDTPVVMVVLDEFPLVSLLDGRGGIDADLYPNFARLAGDATWYRNATGNSVSTVEALPSMLSGRYPGGGAPAPVAGNYPDNLFTLLGASHDVKGSEVVTKLCPRWCENPASVDDAGFDGLLSDAGRLWRQIVSPRAGERKARFATFVEPVARLTAAQARAADDDEFYRRTRPVRFTEFLGAIEPVDGGRPPLHYLHTLMPHQPWRRSPSGARVVPGVVQFTDDREWIDDEWVVQTLRQRHLLSVAYTDRLIGDLLDRLEATGLYDEAVVVVTADHGVRFDPGEPGRGYAAEGVDELLWVPLFIKAPGQERGVVDDRNWEHVDLLPTIADHIGVEVPWEVDGLSAAGQQEERSAASKRVFHEGELVDVDPGRWFPRVLDGSPAELLQATDSTADLFGPGPYGAIVGERVARGSAAVDGATVRLRRRRRFENVRPGRAVPAIVDGTLTGEGAGTGDRWVAVALNGRVAGLSQVFDHDGAAWFEAVVDDRLFEDGANDVQVYEVSGPVADPRLALLPAQE